MSTILSDTKIKSYLGTKYQTIDDLHKDLAHHIENKIFEKFGTLTIGDVDLSKKNIYELLHSKSIILGSPILFNLTRNCNQLSSCYQFYPNNEADLEAVMPTIEEALKHSGGVAIAAHKIRDVIGMMDKLHEKIVKINASNHENKLRTGSVCVYLEPWHHQYLDFLDYRELHPHVKNIFIASWIPNELMTRSGTDKSWGFIQFDHSIGLSDLWGPNFSDKYKKVMWHHSRGEISARRLIREKIIPAALTASSAFIMFKDIVNELSNQSHLGTISCGNLCTEIVQYCNGRSGTRCNLGSINLEQVDSMSDIQKCSKALVIILSALHDVVIEASLVSLHHEIGVGGCGFHSRLMKKKICFDSDEAVNEGRLIAENIYFGAITQSVELAKITKPYPDFRESKYSNNIFHFDCYKGTITTCDWAKLRVKVFRHGLYNALLTTAMPSVATSAILGVSEGWSPWPSMKVTHQMKEGVITYKLPEKVKTAYEIPLERQLQHYIARAPFIDQSQSLTIFVPQDIVDSGPHMLIEVIHQHLKQCFHNKIKTALYYTRLDLKTDRDLYDNICNVCTN